MSKELRGIFPVLSTPFTEILEIDEEDFRREVNYAIEQGAHGVSANGWSSECYKLSCTERMQITDWVIDEVNGRVPVIVGVSAAGTADSVVLARYASKKGAAAVFSEPPIVGEETPQAIYAHFAGLNKAVDIPIIVQKQLVPMPSTLVKRMLEELENVEYIKEESAKNIGQKITEILNLTNKAKVLCDGLNIMDELQRGTVGQMPSCVGLAIYVNIFNSYIQGDLATSWKEYERLMPLITFRQQINHILLTKEYLRQEKVFKGIYTREPIGGPLEDSEINFMNQLIERMSLRT